MMLASSRGYTEIVKYLIEANASLDLQTQVHLVTNLRFGQLSDILGSFRVDRKGLINLPACFPFSVDEIL